jgi:hypothetical protein
MSTKPDQTIPYDERASAIQVAHWLIMALPQELADTLDRFAGSLGPDTTPAAAARCILQRFLLGQPLTPNAEKSSSGNLLPL